jgi:hypothetical protein
LAWSAVLGFEQLDVSPSQNDEPALMTASVEQLVWVGECSVGSLDSWSFD